MSQLFKIPSQHADSDAGMPGFDVIGELSDGAMVVRKIAPNDGEPQEVPGYAEELPEELPADLWREITQSSPLVFGLRKQLQWLIRSRYSESDELQFARMRSSPQSSAASQELLNYDSFVSEQRGWYKAELAKIGLVKAADIAAVPAAVTMRQARLALLGAGLLAGVKAAINALPSKQKEAAKIEWEYATDVQRSSGLVLMLGAALRLDDAALDALFIEAAAL